MKRKLNICFFVHSVVSDWNHGNAHFLRGLMRALGEMGHRVRSYEELGSWSLSNLVAQESDRSIAAIDQFRSEYPELDVRFYKIDDQLAGHLEAELRDADVVIIHEWNQPRLANQVLSVKPSLGFKTLFHDTHHRAYTQAGEMLKFDLHLFDGVLAFGEAVRKIYSDGFGVRRAWTFHEAAAIDAFYPRDVTKTLDVVWIGNWGDEERSRELMEFVIDPITEVPQRRAAFYGVRYPQAIIEALAARGIEYRGYLPNLQAPEVYSQSLLTIHVPRQQYANGLSGIPTIRVFEALACGVPLLCSPWMDTESLFREGEDYLVVHDKEAMTAQMRWLLDDPNARKQLGANGLQTIRERHTCAHRAQQLTEICEELLA